MAVTCLETSSDEKVPADSGRTQERWIAHAALVLTGVRFPKAWRQDDCVGGQGLFRIEQDQDVVGSVERLGDAFMSLAVLVGN